MDLVIALIETPAWLLGRLLGELLHLGAMIGCLAAGVYAGVWVFRLVRTPIVNWVASIVVGCWLVLVLYRAETWTAATWIQATERRDTSDY
jgi:hypothetical protein